MNASKPILIIGVGNPLRQDDGAGAAVVRNILNSGDDPNWVILEHHGEGVALMDAWQGYPEVIVVDATRSGKPPGTIQRFDVSNTTVLPQSLFHYSSHLFGLAEAVALAQSLDYLPGRFIIYGIEGSEFSYGQGLSAPVKKAAVLAARKIMEEFGSISGST